MIALAALAEPEHQGIDLFLPPLYDIFWSAVVLLIIAFVFYRFIMPPLRRIVDERTERIEGGLARAAAAQEKADKAAEEQDRLLAAARADAAKVRDAARAEGKTILDEQVAAARVEAARVSEAASRQIEAERQSVAVSLRGDVGNLATELAERIVGEHLADDAAKSRVVDRFLDQLEAGLDGGTA